MRTPRFLVIRRDNIGDLVCTTPMIRTLRQHYPEARIDALVNTYNAPVLDGNPDVDAVHVYMKAKHREAGRSVIRVYGDRVALFWRLRRERYDYAILAGSGYQARALRTARMVGATHVIGFVHERDYAGPIDRPLWKDPAEVVHEVEIVQRLLRSLGIDEPPPALRLVADARASAQARAGL
ncbi:MAG: glycosyltransferase family 9 protein, partial [Burkholderiales bacterium]|nr:glycosyltransferase family 9 protein [Burkholderiales bacterium]